MKLKVPMSLRLRVALGAAALVALSTAASAGERTLVSAKSDSDYQALRDSVVAHGGRVVRELRQIGLIVVDTDAAGRANLASSGHASGVALDRIVRIVPDQNKEEFFGSAQGNPLLAARLTGVAPLAKTVTADPAFALPGLMWNVERVGAPAVWPLTTGSKKVRVGIADTGLDFTHSELAGKIESVVDFTVTENPAICKTYFSPPKSDSDWSALYGGPATTDWNGHGSWIGGNIAAALDGVGINGIAPKVTLVALKISQWCGSAYDSEILDAFLYAADHDINIVSISFGGYLDRTDPAQETIYQQYVSAVEYAHEHGTIIVAAAGNEHARIGRGGRVLSHGTLTIPGGALFDAYGQYETPGGVPGVIDVSATGNVVNGTSSSCAAGTTGTSATCKPASDAHAPAGVGRKDQLTYYSNYGPRIDFAAPGGARKFNVPSADRGGTAGFPDTTADGYTAWEDFSITSDWALQIPCTVFAVPTIFYPHDCYSSIQGTSMATPHVSAVLALIASAHPELRNRPDELIGLLRDGARQVRGNKTQPLSATDTSPGDRTGIACSKGYCHLGGEAIEDEDVYGAGMIDARVLLRD
jgi:lantibiotic leader peptide-processing serine protease